ncbi:hypothetical protein [Prosthecobacter vanneervenii]|nr:hypothetical protein [Prosthecobacter vanneervenii]
MEIDAAGRWNLGFRYWSHQTPFASAGSSWAFLTEVVQLGQEIALTETESAPLRFRSGTLKVSAILGQKPNSKFSQIKELVVAGLDGLRIGDRLVVFVDSEPYEGGYVVNFHEGGCHVGIRLPAVDDLEFGVRPQNHVLNTLREGRTSLKHLTAEEVQAWILADATGIARAFQVELEKGRLQWKMPE